MFLKNLSYRSRNLSSKNKSDEELILEYRKREDQQIIGVLFDRYIHLVFASCMKYFRNEDDAQDAAMVIFESLPEKLLKFKVDYFKSWLFTTTRNYCLMQLRKKNIIDRIDNFENISGNFMEIDNEEHLDNKYNATDAELQKCLHDLKSEQRECIELMYLKGLSYKAIAEQTGYELKKVKSFIQNGKRNLKQKLENYYDKQD